MREQDGVHSIEMPHRAGHSSDVDQAVVLLVLPDDTVEFGPEGEASAVLHNISAASCLCFRASATDTDIELSPAEGVLPPGKQVHVRLRLTAEGTPERIIIRYALLPPNARASQVTEHLDSLRHAWGSDSRHCQHMLRTTRRTEPGPDDGARGLVGTVVGAHRDASLRARLAAAERLALLRSSQWLKAEQRIAQLESEGTGAPSAPARSLSPVHPRGPGGRVVRSTNAVISLAVTHVLVALAAVAVGATFSDTLIGA